MLSCRVDGTELERFRLLTIAHFQPCVDIIYVGITVTVGVYAYHIQPRNFSPAPTSKLHRRLTTVSGRETVD